MKAGYPSALVWGLTMALSSSAAPFESRYGLTPLGYVPKAQAHFVGEGETVRLENGHQQLVSAGGAPVTTPGLPDEMRTLQAYTWISFSTWMNRTGSPIASFRSTWKVPEAPPTQDGQVIFFFNGLEPTDHTLILQPVLQWGSAEAGGGPYWTVGSWYVGSNGEASYTRLTRVNPGDTLTGVMTLTGNSDGSFSYRSEFEGMPATVLNVQESPELPLATETLESYGISDCSEYPSGDVTFTKIALQTTAGVAPLQWQPQNAVTACGEKVTVIDDSAADGQVTIHMRN